MQLAGVPHSCGHHVESMTHGISQSKDKHYHNIFHKLTCLYDPPHCRSTLAFGLGTPRKGYQHYNCRCNTVRCPSNEWCTLQPSLSRAFWPKWNQGGTHEKNTSLDDFREVEPSRNPLEPRPEPTQIEGSLVRNHHFGWTPGLLL